MKSNLVFNFNVDKENKKIKVDREFAAPVDTVWAAWTQSDILDQWWAPKPWRAETKFMDFTVGGYWLYAMVGPQGEKHWARADYKAIDPKKSYTAQDAFCDEAGTIDESSGRSTWTNTFKGDSSTTAVHIEIQYEKVEDIEKIIAMGFKEGFTAGLQNLEEYLAK